MLLTGSCHCQAVKFTVESVHPYPFNLCYCSICRKTAGGGGYAVNLGGENASLEVKGRKTSPISGQDHRQPGAKQNQSGAKKFLQTLRQCPMGMGYTMA